MSDQALHFPTSTLEAGMDTLLASPRGVSFLDLIVARPTPGQRELPSSAQLDKTLGLLGDGWHARGSKRTPDRSALPDAQLTIMNSRAIHMLAGRRDRWALAGDQLYVDLDLSVEHLPTGTRLNVGEALIEITAEPHTGCGKFKERFGADALAFVNSPIGRALRLRGVYARILSSGMIYVGDPIVRLG